MSPSGAAGAPPGLPPFEHWKVTARIRAGRNPLFERDVRELAELGITHVLDLREEREWTAPGRLGAEAVAAMPALGIVREHLPTPDLAAPDPQLLATAVAWIERTLGRPRHRLYVHCRAGRERTATVLAAWHAWNHTGDPEQSLETLRRHGWPGRPLPPQLDAIRTYLDERRWGLFQDLTGGRPPGGDQEDDDEPEEEDPKEAWRDLRRRLRRNAAPKSFGGETTESARARLAPDAPPCPGCGRPPEDLLWGWYSSPDWTWAQLCGRAGWMVVCTECKREVEFFIEVIS